MNAEFIEALNQLAKEKGIRKELLLDAIEQALISAFKRNFGANQNVRVTVDREDGDVQVFAQKVVVDAVTNAQTEISLEDAQVIRSFYEVGDLLEVEATPRTFGRIAAQTAKQVVVQRIREAERGVIYDEFVEKENEILTAIVSRVENRMLFLEMGRTEGIMEPNQTIASESYEPGDRLKVYVLEVSRSSRGPQVMCSRTNPGLVKRLFELEVPEIAQGIVQIRSISREAGMRTKMAVHSTEAQVDPVGACVGQRGTRVEKVVAELHGEKIDIIKWSSDPAEYISNALSPAKVLAVYVNAAEKGAKVVVPDTQLSLAIGKEGQNARLAAKLTGWKIDIKSQSAAEQVMEGVMEGDYEGYDEMDDAYSDDAGEGTEDI